MILRLHRKIDRLQHYQAGQAQILGGFMHYLEISLMGFETLLPESAVSDTTSSFFTLRRIDLKLLLEFAIFLQRGDSSLQMKHEGFNHGLHG